MISISYTFMFVSISILWIINRFHFYNKNKDFSWKRELQLLLVFICIVVVVRFTFCPFSKVDGKIQPLILDLARIYPFRINTEPFIHLFDYAIYNEAILNLVGNTAMFIPLGIVWPIVYKDLDTPLKVIAAGIGFSLLIEIVQLPFYDRVSDIDDLILNSTGYIIGYVIYLLVKKIKARV